MVDNLEFTVVDAFTTEPFRGNPAAVILFSGESYPVEAFLCKVAGEFNLSETAFLLPHPSSKPAHPSFFIRWKTPDGQDISLCGHGTLASAHFLFSHHFVDRAADIDAIDLYTVMSGVLTVSLSKIQPLGGHDMSPAIEMDFPQNLSGPIHEESVDFVEDIIKAFAGKSASEHIRGEDIEQVGRTVDNRYVVIVNERVNVGELNHINHSVLERIGARMISISSRVPATFSVPFASPTTGEAVKPDYLVRVFSSKGMKEDPVTGSAQTSLCPYWTEQGLNGKRVGDTLYAYQAYPGRGGVIQLLWEKERGRVKFVGSSRTVMQGTLYH
ncbi:hypothetical protein BJ742DRAFT_767931 [Cladochytrium replicatum]|nr:hypothetical protein BJ742DRAFT_767931 [Cladochytrium replicatum]